MKPAAPETEFQQLVRHCLAAGVDVHVITKEFGVSVPTVNRWAEGRSRPVPYLREEVESFLRAQLLKH